MRRVAACLVLLAACGSSAPPPLAPPVDEAPPAAPAGSTDAQADEFARGVTAMGLTFAAPAGFEAVAVEPNIDVAYDHALRRPDGRVEIRYALRPYAPDAPEGARTLDFSRAFFATAILNLVHGGHTGEVADPEPVPAADLGADDGQIVVMRFFDDAQADDHFAHGFAAGVAIWIHRGDRGDAYTFVLLRDQDDAALLDDATLTALRFAPRG